MTSELSQLRYQFEQAQINGDDEIAWWLALAVIGRLRQAQRVGDWATVKRLLPLSNSAETEFLKQLPQRRQLPNEVSE